MARFGLDPAHPRSVFTFTFECPSDKDDLLTFLRRLAPLLNLSDGFLARKQQKVRTYESFLTDIELMYPVEPTKPLMFQSVRYSATYKQVQITAKMDMRRAQPHAMPDGNKDKDTFQLTVSLILPGLCTLDVLNQLVEDDTRRTALRSFENERAYVYDLRALYRLCDVLEVAHDSFLPWDDFGLPLGTVAVLNQETGRWTFIQPIRPMAQELAVLFFDTTEPTRYVRIQSDTTNRLYFYMADTVKCASLVSTYTRWTTDIRPVPIRVTFQLRDASDRSKNIVFPKGMLSFPLLTIEEWSIPGTTQADTVQGVRLTRRARYAGGAPDVPLEG